MCQEIRLCSRYWEISFANTAKYFDGDFTVVLTETGEILFRNRAPGLSQVEADRLFDRFYTVENAKGSTGLGLSIAKQLTSYLATINDDLPEHINCQGCRA